MSTKQCHARIAVGVEELAQAIAVPLSGELSELSQHNFVKNVTNDLPKHEHTLTDNTPQLVRVCVVTNSL